MGRPSGNEIQPQADTDSVRFIICSAKFIISKIDDCEKININEKKWLLIASS
jgi:hypothetical protein